jgi:hypothetical protein
MTWQDGGQRHDQTKVGQMERSAAAFDCFGATLMMPADG